jgi:hypothetical protein
MMSLDAGGRNVCVFFFYQDPDLLPAEVERDGPAELGGGAGEEHLPDVAGDLVQDHRRRQRVAVHDPHPQVRVLAHEQRAATVERLVLTNTLFRQRRCKPLASSVQFVSEIIFIRCDSKNNRVEK